MDPTHTLLLVIAVCFAEVILPGKWVRVVLLLMLMVFSCCRGCCWQHHSYCRSRSDTCNTVYPTYAYGSLL